MAQDNDGPISEIAFKVSIGVFFGLAVIAVLVRCFVLRVFMDKKRFQIDDALLVTATGLLVSTIIIMYRNTIKSTYSLTDFEHEASGNEMQADELPENIVQMALDFHKWVVTSMMLSWLSIYSIKFFFLVFFWRLVDRLRPWKIYWWFVFCINLAIATFGVTTFYVSCPHWDEKAFQCPTGGELNTVTRYALAQIILDIAADVIIMTIPISIIWKAQMNWKQKMGLGSSLSFTLILVGLSITRGVGLRYTGNTYDTWQMYWLAMTANFSLLLAAGSAFRAFYVSHRHSKNYSNAFDRETKDSTNRHSNGSKGSSKESTRKGETFFSDSESDRTAVSSSKHMGPRRLEGSYIQDLEWHSTSSCKDSISSRDTRDTKDTDETVNLSTAAGFFHIQRARRVIIAPRMC